MTRLLLVLTVSGLAACDERTTMNALDPTKYFPDPRAASFVDDVQRGNVAGVKAALAAGMNPNFEGNQGFRPIHFVFFAKSPEVLHALLQAGADPNARLAAGNTPLHFSVRNRDPEFTRALLAAGANPNSPGADNKPPIHEAIYQDNPAHVSELAAAGADLNAVWGGATPVMSALSIGQWEQAKILIDSGASLDFKNYNGKTALDRACRFLQGLPTNDNNKKGVAAVVQSLGKRNVTLPCEGDVARFR
jgi:ankyrin repeat protein